MNVENPREMREENGVVTELMVAGVTQDEVEKELKMNRGKVLGTDNIPIEAWISQEEAGVGYLTSLFNKVLAGERMPDEWRKSPLIPICKNKGDAQDCGRSTKDTIFALRMLMEKYREGQRQFVCVFMDLEKAYDRVPREALCHYIIESSISEVYVREAQDMYNDFMTAVRSVVATTEGVEMEVGLQQGRLLKLSVDFQAQQETLNVSMAPPERKRNKHQKQHGISLKRKRKEDIVR
ncbi:uncharacterized protein LOC125045285 [Penaeus chinensis]|uniref:uncharacterized protein LOC125045285 n=1 Tax=Penaeus chinensis TaxID=139456 RepID=UPI001FB5B2EF|nr:uncharacterized protein LOC125045285 [Penaeus chinensis]